MVRQDSPEAHNELMANCSALKYEFCSRATTDKTQILPTDVRLVIFLNFESLRTIPNGNVIA